jgi:hypothetical protein
MMLLFKLSDEKLVDVEGLVGLGLDDVVLMVTKVVGVVRIALEAR